MPAYKVLFYFVFLFTTQSFLFGQEKDRKVVDSLVTLEFEELSEKIFKTYKTNKIDSELYAKAYLSKGKKEYNLINTAIGYINLSHFYTNDLTQQIKYYDSAIAITKNIQHNRYPIELYIYIKV